MPAEVCRTSPARSISRCEAICASAGVSFMVGMKLRERRIAGGSVWLRGADPNRRRADPASLRCSVAENYCALHKAARAIKSLSTARLSNKTA